MKSTSGIRGIVGRSIDPLVVTRYAAAFARFLKKGKVVVGRDSRPSGEFILNQVVSTLAMAGCEVINCGIIPTPTVAMEVMHHRAAGGVCITASHNPAQWNALKFFNRQGEFLTNRQFLRMERLVEGDLIFPLYSGMGSITIEEGAIERHIKSVLKIGTVSLKKIRRSRFTVVVDAINGAGSTALPVLLERMGVKVIRINCKGDGDFVHQPEPVAGNLEQLARAVRRHKADLGMACDPDADRLALVDELGRPIGEELTLTLAVAYYLLKIKGPVVVNLSTSRVTIDVARMNGCRAWRSPVGEANVIAEMRRRKAVIGGEGNGGIILPECHYGRDALVAAALILSYLAESKRTLSDLSGTLPAYINIKKKAPLPNRFARKIKAVEKEIEAVFRNSRVDRRDGLRIDLDEGWVQIRKSNTEPIYRLIIEAQSKKLASKLAATVGRALK